MERVAAAAKKVTELSMHTTGHHQVFDPGTQVGVGEDTFRRNSQDHGVVMVQLRGGRIARRRQSQTESSSSFEELSAATGI